MVKNKSRLFYFALWFSALILGGFILSLPAIIHSDGLTTDFCAFQHKGIYLLDDFDFEEVNLYKGDRIFRINDCEIVDLVTADCEASSETDGYTYEIVRAGHQITLNTTPIQPAGAYFEPHIVEIIGFVAMMLGGLVLLFFIGKVFWYPNLLTLTLFFGLSFSLHAVHLPVTLLTRPVLFWGFFFLRLVVFVALYAAAFNLLLTYPQQRFKIKRTRQILIFASQGITYLAIIITILFNQDPITAIRLSTQIYQVYAVILLGMMITTFIYHLRHSKRPMINLRFRWLRIGGITVALFLLLLTAFIALTASDFLISQDWSFASMIKIITHPLLLLLLISPFFYAVPLAETYPRKIDNLENRVVFYLILGTILVLIYILLGMALQRFNLERIFNNPYSYLGFVLVLVVMLVLAMLRRPVDILINRWFYRERLKYQTLLPGFILELNSNLNYNELVLLLLTKLPRDFQIDSSELLLRDPGGETFSMLSPDDDQPKLRISKNHPLVQHFNHVRKPILRYLDQKHLHPGIVAVLEKYSLEVAIPLIHLGNLVGIYFLRDKESGTPYAISEVNVLAELDQWAGTALFNTQVLSQKEDYSRSLEIDLEQQSRELDRVVDETRQFRISNRKRFAQQETILDLVHHDLNEPLTALSALIEDLSGDHPRHGEIAQHTEQLSQRLDTFMLYSALQIERFQPKAESTDLAGLFESVIINLEKEIPNIHEVLSFHIEAHAPMVVMLDREHVRQLLVLLLQITISNNPHQPYVISCHQDQFEYSQEDAPQRIIFECRAHPGAIILEQMDFQADQIPLKLELAQLLCSRLGGELRREPNTADANFPFQFNLKVSLPTDSYPAFLGVNLPFLNDKSIVIYECDPTTLKHMTLQASSWGMKVTSLTEENDFIVALQNAQAADLLLINAQCLQDSAHRQDYSLENLETKVVLYRLQENETVDDQETDNPSSEELEPADLYNLITRALLFSTTAEQYPHLPRALQLNPDYLNQNRTVLVVGNQENRPELAFYLPHLNLDYSIYDGSLKSLPHHISTTAPDAVLFELASKDQQEWDILQNIRSMELQQQPFIIAISDNAVRFPALTAMKSGADKYLLKPYTIEELLTLLAGWLNLVNQ